ncbi:MAG: SPOR domain-containing protein [Candidatus Sedimenticola sp. PURPLELP]
MPDSHRSYHRLLFIGLILLISGCASNEARTGYTAYLQGDYEAAAKQWTSRAEQGDPQAQFYLSMLYLNGKGVTTNNRAGMEWLGKAAQAGHAAAQLNLGNHHFQGRHVKQDYLQAAEWWEKSAEQGTSQAAFNLGNLHYNGYGVPRNTQEAIHWYKLAALNGSRDAEQALARVAPQNQLRTAVAAKPDQPPLASKQGASKQQTVQPQPVKQTIATAIQTEMQKAQQPASTANTPQAWIKSQPGKNYTLQIIAAEDRATVEKRVTASNLEKDTVLFRFSKNGRTWYAATYGSYPSFAKAKEASRSLPVRPWIRRFEGIHKIMLR